jgi:hypothetical protein
VKVLHQHVVHVLLLILEAAEVIALLASFNHKQIWQ